MKLATYCVRGSGEQLGRRPELQDPPVHDHADTIGKCRRVLEVVRDEQCRQPQLGQQLGELAAHDAAGVGVERGERLVEQQHGRVAGECPRKRDPLPLTPREVCRPRLREV